MSKVVDLHYKPRKWQLECHKRKKRFTVLALHRRSGKTELAIAELLDKALRFDKELGFFVYLAPFLKQARAIAWARLKQRCNSLVENNVVEVSESDLSVKVKKTGAVVRLFGGDNPDALRGVRLDGIVIDEVAQIKPEVWQDIIQPALSDRMGWAIFIGTPNGINLFSELYFRADGSPDWYSAKYTVYETDSLDADEVARLKRDMTENSFAREMLCDFSASGEDQLLSLAEIHDAAKRFILEADYSYAPKIIGIDPARFGDDHSAVVLRQGLMSWVLLDKPKLDNMELAARVAEEIDRHKPHAVFCDAGAGAGVIDRLRMLGHDVMEIAFAGQPINVIYANKRAEIWHEMKDWIRQGGAVPDDIRLKQDLGAPCYFFNNAGKIQLESKESIKKRGLPSPDCFVAGTMVMTPKGEKAIETISVGDCVIAPFGTRRVIAVHRTLTNEIAQFTLPNGRVLSGKPGHRIYVYGQGLKQLSKLVHPDKIEMFSIFGLMQWRYLNFKYTKGKNIGFKARADIINPAQSLTKKGFFTDKSTLTLTGRYPMACAFTTLMEIGQIIAWSTWNCLIKMSMAGTTWLNALNALVLPGKTEKTWARQLLRRLNGISRKPVRNGTSSMGRKPGPTERLRLKLLAFDVATKSLPIFQPAQSFVQNCADSGMPLSAAGLPISKLALNAASITRQTRIETQFFVQENAPQSLTIETVVYNLTLDAENMYYANGALVENCADALALTFAVPVSKKTELKYPALNYG